MAPSAGSWGLLTACFLLLAPAKDTSKYPTYERNIDFFGYDIDHTVECVKTAGCVAFTFQGMEDEGVGYFLFFLLRNRMGSENILGSDYCATTRIV
eukprot:1366462-Amorphochlora_amoeboformis.AAC.1